MFDHIIYQF